MKLQKKWPGRIESKPTWCSLRKCSRLGYICSGPSVYLLPKYSAFQLFGYELNWRRLF